MITSGRERLTGPDRSEARGFGAAVVSTDFKSQCGCRLQRESFNCVTLSEGQHFTFYQHHTQIQQRAWSHFKGLGELFFQDLTSHFFFFFKLPVSIAHLPTFSTPQSHSKSTEMMLPIKSVKRTSPGRAVRGKLVNIVLYCTHDICSPHIYSFFSLFFWCEQQKLALHVLHPIEKFSV